MNEIEHADDIMLSSVRRTEGIGGSYVYYHLPYGRKFYDIMNESTIYRIKHHIDKEYNN